MPRPPRVNVPGGTYHVTARGNRGHPVFADDRDGVAFFALFGGVVARLTWRCHAFCLMPNHYHAVIETQEANLSAGMQYLNSRYAEWFNRRHRLKGHLFQGRFHSVLVESTRHLLELSRYISLNPVRAGLCVNPAHWRWSSYRAVAGLGPAPPFLAAGIVLEHFGRPPSKARLAFRRFVCDGLPTARRRTAT